MPRHTPEQRRKRILTAGMIALAATIGATLTATMLNKPDHSAAAIRQCGAQLATKHDNILFPPGAHTADHNQSTDVWAVTGPIKVDTRTGRDTGTYRCELRRKRDGSWTLLLAEIKT